MCSPYSFEKEKTDDVHQKNIIGDLPRISERVTHLSALSAV